MPHTIVDSALQTASATTRTLSNELADMIVVTMGGTDKKPFFMVIRLINSINLMLRFVRTMEF
jgi:hypothetical protein